MSKDLAIPMTLPTGNMDAYISAAFQLPMLSAEEEHELAVRLRDHQDLAAAQRMVMSHLRLCSPRTRASGIGNSRPRSDPVLNSE